MISRIQRINAFINLGKFITNPQNEPVIEEWIARANSKNNWFTPENVARSLNALAHQFLNADKLNAWVARYPESASSQKIGVVMAGNIPAVGFHDALSVIISGHILLAKPSSDDQMLIHSLLGTLVELEPGLSEHIRFVERLNEADAYIATGSDNTARYFHYYFAKKPNIIRKNRTSVAVLTGHESSEELAALGRDALQYFGLGCRNVSKLFVPAGYDFTKFYESIQDLDKTYLHHHKYFNNYEYNKSIFLVNRVPHYDNGFLLLTESKALVSAISVLHYETYESISDIEAPLKEQAEKIQCVVTNADIDLPGLIPFGKTQEPGLTDYADAVDTMAFLAEF
ncbi:acyl-CoA reductase [Dyadobacter fanqingshengii]|uniref:Acyl-CoA reductase n=1 Tax=Dyadobacter fanqingshengii TaxID=2906443 RepID=A0A9X1PC26_9BACT|nr:acyl-CoA reductase [Dyadobacter fanqingshengii]MCF0040725.1 acyl-CoA reductase [Dyadobacter fanqingshengii]USJ37538.1 acyl-CoA reductase [Dyadobacter fanqingshengii]